MLAYANQAIAGSIWQEPFTTIGQERGLAVGGPVECHLYPNHHITPELFREKLLSDGSRGMGFLRADTRGVRDYARAMLDRGPAAFDEVVPILIEYTTVKDRALYEKTIPSGLKVDPFPNLQSLADDQEY